MNNKGARLRWVYAALLFFCIVFMQMSFSCLPPLFSEISKDIPLSKSMMGIIFGMVPLAGVLFSLVGGAVSDKLGSRFSIGIAFLIISMGGGLRSLADGPFELVCLTFAVGAGLAFVPPNVAKVLGEQFPKHELGLANGIVLAASPIGIGIGLGTGSSVLSPLFGGWRGTLVFISALCLFVGLTWVFLYRGRQTSSDPEQMASRISINFREVFAVKDIWWLSVFIGCFFFTVGSLVSLLPIVLEERGIARAGQMAALLMAADVLGCPLGGVVSDRSGHRKRFLVFSAIVMGVCVPFFTIFNGTLLFVSIIVAGLAQGMVMPVMAATVIEIEAIGSKLAATAIGLILTVGGGMGAFGPIVSGKLIDMIGYPQPAFIVLTIILIAGAGVAGQIKTAK